MGRISEERSFCQGIPLMLFGNMTILEQKISQLGGVVPLLISEPALKQKLEQIRLVIFDVDGVLTDGLAYYDNNGMAFKSFSMRDGFGFVLAKFSGLELACLTGNVAEMVKRRLEAFGITRIKGGHFRKSQFFEEILQETGIDRQLTAYVGDDIFDLPVLSQVGLAIAPADAHPEVLSKVHAITSASGGKGVVREVVEAIVKAKGIWEQVLLDIERDERGGRG